MELMQASHQWASRPSDERYTSLPEMLKFFQDQRANSKAIVVPNKHVEFVPVEGDIKGLNVVSASSERKLPYAPNHWAFGQLCALSESPAGYLRTLPTPIVADALNYKLKFVRSVEDIGLLLYKNGTGMVRAATGPNYGRIWNDDICETLIQRFGDGRTGDWKVPGEFGKDVVITKANTTLFAGDRNMFVFLADEKNKVVVPNRRNGEQGQLSRGFFIWNSEVGDTTLGIGTFLFDYACCNRIVWGAEMYREIRIRHTASAPIKWVDEVQPVLEAYRNASAQPIEDAIKAAQAKKVDDIDEFLKARFSKGLIQPIKKIHELEEGRPIETLWDVTTAVTAYARGVAWQDARVGMERQAGDILKLAA